MFESESSVSGHQGIIYFDISFFINFLEIIWFVCGFFIITISSFLHSYITMSNGPDSSWTTARYILNKIDKDCTIARLRHHNQFRRSFQDMMEVCNGVIRANANNTPDDISRILEKSCVYKGTVPHMLALPPEAQQYLTSFEENSVYEQQTAQFRRLSDLVSDDAQRKIVPDPNFYLVLDLDHTIINTYEYSAQVRFLTSFER